MNKEDSYLQTYSRKKFFPFNPSHADIDLQDISHALGQQCRFSGHTNYFFSVAQHSYYVSLIIEQLGGSVMDQLVGLLHDSPETYLVDLPSPVKIHVEGYKDLEHRVMDCVCQWAGLPPQEVWSPLIKKADLIALATEARDLMNDPKDWSCLTEAPINWRVQRWSLRDGAQVFRMYYNYLQECLMTDEQIALAHKIKAEAIAHAIQVGSVVPISGNPEGRHYKAVYEKTFKAKYDPRIDPDQVIVPTPTPTTGQARPCIGRQGII